MTEFSASAASWTVAREPFNAIPAWPFGPADLATSLNFSKKLAVVKFNLIDRIESLSDQRIVAVKCVSLAEEYLADHFPTFPVLPGVMMLEAITQAAGWLMHHRSGFARSMAVLAEARNVKYGAFVAPGNFLRLEVEFARETDRGASFKAAGTVSEKQALQARVELAYFDLGQKRPELAGLDERIKEYNRRRWNVLAGQASHWSLVTGQ